MVDTASLWHLPADGVAFETLVETVFWALGYTVAPTPASHDFGADLIMTSPTTGTRIVVQAKFYAGSAVGLDAVQEAFSAKAHYQAHEAWVVTQSGFTAPARDLAASCGVCLIDGNALNDLLDQARAHVNKPASVEDATTSGFVQATEAPEATHQPATAPAGWLTMQEVCERWGVTPARVKQAIDAGLPMKKNGAGRWIIESAALARWEHNYQREQQTYQNSARLRRALPWLLLLLFVLVALTVFIQALPTS
jgi:restriction system protein